MLSHGRLAPLGQRGHREHLEHSVDAERERPIRHFAIPAVHCPENPDLILITPRQFPDIFSKLSKIEQPGISRRAIIVVISKPILLGNLKDIAV